MALPFANDKLKFLSYSVLFVNAILLILYVKIETRVKVVPEVLQSFIDDSATTANESSNANSTNTTFEIQFKEELSRYHEKEVLLPECGCKRTILAALGSKDSEKDVSSSCSNSSYKRGSRQKVVSFCLYQPRPGENQTKEIQKFKEGISLNLHQIFKLYGPEWVVRVYHDLSNMSWLCPLACANPQMDLCDAANTSFMGNATFMHPMLWRVLPVYDNQVSVFFSRDLDSLVTAREAAAVSEFLSSDLDFHMMRDHWVQTSKILGGMWGAKLDKGIRPILKKAMAIILQNSTFLNDRHRKGKDQWALTGAVLPMVYNRSMAHDSYHCKDVAKKVAEWRPFPTRREEGPNNFVGSRLVDGVSLKDVKGKGRKSECPVECRPKAHKDWKFC